MKNIQIGLVLSVSLIFSIGLLMVFNTTAAEIIDRSLSESTYSALFKQIIYACLGLCCGFCVYRLGHQKILEYSPFLLIFTTFLLLLLFVPGISLKINGARRWLYVFGFSFQPSECAKILIPAVFIHWFLKNENRFNFHSFLKILLWLAIPLGLILIQPDNGTVAIIIAMMVILFFLTKIRPMYWAIPLICLIGMVGVIAFQMPHVKDRIAIFLNPELDLLGKGHQPHQAKIAAGSGGFWGRGFGESLQKLNYLPEARNDYIAAIFAEEMGFVGMFILICLYSSFAFFGFSIAFRSKEIQSFLFGSLLTSLISIQAFLNLGIVSGILPSKGTTLPFFSQGGSSLIVNLIALFLLLDMARLNQEYELT